MEGPLSGVRVVDLTRYVAGPFCTRLLAGLGAEVVKVEPPGGDPMRRIGPFSESTPSAEKSVPFMFLNAGKKSMTLDLQNEAGRSILKELVAKADVLVESFSPGVMANLGLGYEALESINPKLIMTSISNFGATGPYRDFEAFAINLFALGGYMYLNGDPDREPLNSNPFDHQGLYQAGIHGAVATMATLYDTLETGKGAHIDVSIMESVVSLTAVAPKAYYVTGETYVRTGSRLFYTPQPQSQYPSTVRPCKDGHVFVHTSGAGPEMLAVMMEEPRLNDPAIRQTPRGHADEIDSLMEPWLMQHGKMEIFELGQAFRLAIAAVLNPDEVVEDPQHKERGIFAEVNHSELGKLPMVGAPFQLGETPWLVGRSPMLGENNVEILGQRLGYGQADIVRLRQMNVI